MIKTIIDIEEIEPKTVQDIVGASEEYIFTTSLDNYSTIIYNNYKKVKVIERFICKGVSDNRETIILSGSTVKEDFSRLGTIIYLKKRDLEVAKKIIDTSSIFSEFVWSNSKIIISNSYKDGILNGDIIELDTMKKIKLPIVLVGEYEFKGAVIFKDNYIVYGNDKDNYRGIIVKLNNNIELYDIHIDNELWEFTNIRSYEDQILLSGNKWNKLGFNGFIMKLADTIKYEIIDISLESSWFETIGICKVNDSIITSIFDFDNNEGILLEIDKEGTKIIDKRYNKIFKIINNKLFLKRFM